MNTPINTDDSNQIFRAYKEIFSYFGFEGHFTKTSTNSDLSSYYVFSGFESHLEVSLNSQNQRLPFSINNEGINAYDLSNLLFSLLPSTTKQKFLLIYKTMQKDPITLEINFYYCLDREQDAQFKKFLADYITPKKLKLKNNKKHYFILEFSLFFEQSERIFEAFYERKHKDFLLIGCYENGKIIEPDFYLSLLKDVENKMNQNHLVFPLSASPTQQSKEMNSFLSKHLITEYKKTNDYKIREIFQPL